MESCHNSGIEVENHFGDLTEMVSLGSGAKREIQSFALSRYACYLIVQNADPSKEIVALGQTYFAVQTRKQELTELAEYSRLEIEDDKRIFLRNEMRTHNKQLADAARNAGVIKPVDYVIIHELCHLVYPHHDRQFYRLLSRILPDWIKRKERLEKVVL